MYYLQGATHQRPMLLLPQPPRPRPPFDMANLAEQYIVAVCCRLLQYDAMYCSLLLSAAVCCRTNISFSSQTMRIQSVAVRCSLLQSPSKCLLQHERLHDAERHLKAGQVQADKTQERQGDAEEGVKQIERGRDWETERVGGQEDRESGRRLAV